MATRNVTLPFGVWTRVADAFDASCLIQARDAGVEYQVAATHDTAAPTVAGHLVSDKRDAIRRTDIGDGHLHVRITRLAPRPGPARTGAVFIVSGSSLSLT